MFEDVFDPELDAYQDDPECSAWDGNVPDEYGTRYEEYLEGKQVEDVN